MRTCHFIPAFCFITIVVYLTCCVAAQQLPPEFQVSPSKITIRLSKSFWWKEITVTPSVTLNVHGLSKNVSVVDVFADTFFEEQDRRPPFSSKAISFTISQTTLDDLKRVEIQINFNLPPNLHSGSYNSKIYVTSSSGSTVEIPIILKVSASEWVVGCLVFMGVLLNLSLFMIKDVVDERNNLREAVNRTDELLIGAYYSVNRAFNEERLDDLEPTSSYGMARVELEDLIHDWNRAIESKALAETFNRLGKSTERIVKLADDAEPIKDDVVLPSITIFGRLGPPIDDFRTKKNPEDRFEINILRDSLFRSRNVQYFTLALIFGIIVMNSWQTYLNEVMEFGASGLADYIAAILFGFGSQTILTQGVGMARSWAESRSI